MKLCSWKRLGRVRLRCGVRALAGLIASLTVLLRRHAPSNTSNSHIPNLRCAFLYIYKSSDPVVCFQRGLVPACRMAKVRTRSFSRPAFERK
jgi:hypothetical protein